MISFAISRNWYEVSAMLGGMFPRGILYNDPEKHSVVRSNSIIPASLQRNEGHGMVNTHSGEVTMKNGEVFSNAKEDMGRYGK